MIAQRVGTGWQTLMTDLSIILFMITAAALAQQDPEAVAQAAQTPSQRSEPVAVYRAGKDAPPLGQWLADQPRDPRQMLTIVSTYAAGQENAALDLATSLAREAGKAGQASRVVIEPGLGEATATLGYDSNTPLLAQALQRGSVPNSQGDNR